MSEQTANRLISRDQDVKEDSSVEEYADLDRKIFGSNLTGGTLWRSRRFTSCLVHALVQPRM